MLTDQLYDPDERHLPLDESIRRIAPAFRRVTFDRGRGGARLHQNYKRMVARGTPEIILQSQRALSGQAVWVSVSDDDHPGGWINFLLIDSVDVWIHYPSDAERARFRPVVLKLAGLLEYEVAARESPHAEPGSARASGDS